MADAAECCGTCKHLDVPLDKAGRRVVRDHAYPCVWYVERPRLPDSVTRAYIFCIPLNQDGRRRMLGTDGTNCPCYEKR